MALQDGARIKETTTTTGTTAALVLAGAVTNYNPFSVACGNLDTIFYWLFDANGTQWECGIGTYATGLNDLNRTTVIKNSLGTTARITLSSGSHTVLNAPVNGYLTGDVAASNINMQHNTLLDAVLLNYQESVYFSSITSGTYTLLDFINYQTVVQNGAMTLAMPAVTITSGVVFKTVLDIVYASGILTFPTAGFDFAWKDGIVPTISTTSGKTNRFLFSSIGGSTWTANYVGAY